MRIPVTPVFDPDLPTALRPDDRPGCGEARTAGRALPLTAIDIDARLSGLTVSCRLRQRFTNPTEQPVEVTYIFPLPNRGAVTAMTATLGGRRVEGRLLERGRARQSYEEALAAGQRASLAEKDRPDVFTVTLGNLRPGEDAEVDLDLVCPLEVDDGEATFRFPLVVAPRYTSGMPLDVDPAGGGVAADTDAVPDASRVTPPRLRPEDPRPELRCRVVIDDAGLGLTGWRSSLHALTVDDGAFRLEPGERLDRDLILRANLPRDRFVTAAVAVADPEGPEGTWMLSLVPPDAGAAQPPRDVVVLLDRSGSMGGWKLVAARRAAARLVDGLGANDRFAVLAFDNTLESPTTALTPATDRNRFAAIGWLASLEARGGTELGMALGGASELVRVGIGGRARSLVLITDGQVSGEDAVVTAVSRRLDGVTVHCVGIDQAVNAGLLDRLTRRSGGRLELVESEDRLDECLVRVGRAVNPPVLTDVEVTVGGAEAIAGTITPPVRDAVAGIPLVIAGRYRAARPGTPITLALHAGGPASGALPATVTAVAEETPAVAVLWARSLIADLEDRYAAGDRDPGLASRTIDVSRRFGVLSRFTAFVAVDPERGQTDDLISITQPVEQPAGWAGSSAGSPRYASAAAPMAAPGVSAVRPSMRPGSAGGRGFAAPGAPPAATPRRARAPRASAARVPLRLPAGEVPLLAEVGQLLSRLGAGEAVSAAAVRRCRRKVAKLVQGSPRSALLEQLGSALAGLADAIAQAPGPASEDDRVRQALAGAQKLLDGLGSGADAAPPAADRRFWQPR